MPKTKTKHKKTQWGSTKEETALEWSVRTLLEDWNMFTVPTSPFILKMINTHMYLVRKDHPRLSYMSCSCLVALWSPTGKGLNFWLSRVLLLIVVSCVTFLYCLPDQVWYLIVSNPDPGLPLYFKCLSILVDSKPFSVSEHSAFLRQIDSCLGSPHSLSLSEFP